MPHSCGIVWRALSATVIVLSLTAVERASVSAAAGRIAVVTYIDRGLGVVPPRATERSGRVRMPLFAAYGLRTRAAQRAAIAFRDGTTLDLNARTDAVLQDPTLVRVRSGEVALSLKPGTRHRIQTAAALATAIGTTYNVNIQGDDTTFTVATGAVLVSNRFGAVVVKTNQQSTAGVDAAPTQPEEVDAAAVLAWTAGLPRPNLGENVALDANGGGVVAVSSQDRGIDGRWDARFMDDGTLTTGWRSAPGRTSNQWATFRLAGGRVYRVTDVLIDPAATGGNPPAADLRRFAIRVSTTGTAPRDFTTVATGVCRRRNALQAFHFPRPLPARYVRLSFRDNYGGTRYVEVSEVEVIAKRGTASRSPSRRRADFALWPLDRP